MPRLLTAKISPRARRAYSFLLRVGIVFAALLCAACAATRYLDVNYNADLLSNFQVLYLLAGAVLAVLSAVLKFRAGLAVSLVLVLFQVPAFWPYFFGGKPSNETANLRVAVANIYGANQNFGAFGEWIDDVQPDVILLQETEVRWTAYLELIEEEYPHVAKVEHTQWGFSARVYSRYPLLESEVIEIPHEAFPVQRVVIAIGGRHVAIYNAHLFWSSEVRDRQNETLRKVLQAEAYPHVFAGDFNSTIWSVGQRNLVEGLDLRNASFGFGYKPTWPARVRPVLQHFFTLFFLSRHQIFRPDTTETVAPLLARFVGIPIDHAYVSPEIGVVSCERGPNINSDHLPLLFDLHIPTASGGG